jgi:hypothetical protein
MVSWGGVRLCQSSWYDPAVRSHVGSLGGAVRLTVIALLPLQLLAVCHPGGQDPGSEYLGIDPSGEQAGLIETTGER